MLAGFPAVSTILAGGHTDKLDELGLPLGPPAKPGACALTAIVIPLLVAVAGAIQVALDVITTEIISPLLRVLLLLVNVARLVGVPRFTPFMRHWKVGAAPLFTGVAVKVVLPEVEQMLVADAEMVTDGVSNGFTVMVISLPVAGLPIAQVALEVSTTVTLSPLARALLL